MGLFERDAHSEKIGLNSERLGTVPSFALIRTNQRQRVGRTFQGISEMEQVLTASQKDRWAYRVSDACLGLGISRTSFYELVKSGEIKTIKIAGRTLVPRTELERLTRVDRDKAA